MIKKLNDYAIPLAKIQDLEFSYFVRMKTAQFDAGMEVCHAILKAFESEMNLPKGEHPSKFLKKYFTQNALA